MPQIIIKFTSFRFKKLILLFSSCFRKRSKMADLKNRAEVIVSKFQKYPLVLQITFSAKYRNDFFKQKLEHILGPLKIIFYISLSNMKRKLGS